MLLICRPHHLPSPPPDSRASPALDLCESVTALREAQLEKGLCLGVRFLLFCCGARHRARPHLLFLKLCPASFGCIIQPCPWSSGFLAAGSEKRGCGGGGALCTFLPTLLVCASNLINDATLRRFLSSELAAAFTNGCERSAQ